MRNDESDPGLLMCSAWLDIFLLNEASETKM